MVMGFLKNLIHVFIIVIIISLFAMVYIVFKGETYQNDDYFKEADV